MYVSSDQSPAFQITWAGPIPEEIARLHENYI